VQPSSKFTQFVEGSKTMSDGYRKLYRSRKERMIAGVCGGLGDYFDIDPTLIRLLFVVGTLFGGPMGPLAYLVFMIVVPNEAEVPPSVSVEKTDSE
jgi:phage shock protein C